MTDVDEIEYQLLRRAWFPVARVDDLDNGVAAGNILGTALVIYRVADTVTVADGWCPHRGMALWLGRVADGGLECPYHGWLFAPTSGRCLRIPSLPDPTEEHRYQLRTYPARTAYGLVWTCLDEPFLPFPELPS